jgi:hypothetical protein
MKSAIRLLFVEQQPYSGVGRLSVEVSRAHTQTYADTHGRIPLDEGSARRRDLYLTTHNVHVKHPCLWRG